MYKQGISLVPDKGCYLANFLDYNDDISGSAPEARFGRVWEAIILMAPRWLYIILCFVHHFQYGHFLPGLDPC